ncbi:MAG: NAD(P)-dependent oxidoreductase [Pseudomonadota bacterium]|nr:NAD(P)-dependent oxidoreductase [Pseudomonadota bacterium]
MADRILVTGGTGYAGRFIVEDLLQAGKTITVAGRKPPPARHFSRPIGFLPLVLDPDAIGALVLEGFDAVVHAAFHHVPGRYRGGEGDDPAGFCRSNLEGSRALFEAAKQAGIARLVFLSSRAVYGSQPAGAGLSEETACFPDTLYGEVKLAAERALAAMSEGDFATISLRATGIYGPAAPGMPHKWSALFDSFLAGNEIAPRAGTEVHGRDVASAVRLVLEADFQKVSGLAFNVSDMLLDRRDLLALVNELAGTDHALPPAADVSRFNPMDCSRLRGLGWRPGGLALLRETVREWLGSRHAD